MEDSTDKMEDGTDKMEDGTDIFGCLWMAQFLMSLDGSISAIQLKLYKC